MGGIYHPPYGERNHIVVTDPDPQLERPPRGDEGRIANVEFDHVLSLGHDRHWYRCLACPRTFTLADPHVKISARINKRHGEVCARGRCCSRECWLQWATA